MLQTLFRLAWRNIWRQKRRTFLTLSAISLGLAMVIIIDSLVLGMRQRVFRISTESMLGQAQIHAPQYLSTGDPELFMDHASEKLALLSQTPGIEAASKRLFGPVMAAMGDRSASLTLIGIDLEREPTITNWDKHLLEGAWPSSERQVLIGTKLATKLEVGPDSKLVLTAASLETGELISMLVHVSGVLMSENGELNQYMVIAPYALAQSLLGVGDVAHEFILRTDQDPGDSLAIESALAKIDLPGLEAIPWQARMVGLIKAMEIQDLFMWVAFIVVFVLAALGIANTMGMSILERVREFGVLQALGTDPRELGTLIVLEYTMLGILGTCFGFCLATFAILLAGRIGIPLSDLEVAGMVINEPLYPIFKLVSTLQFTLVFACLVPVLAIYSVKKVLALDPARALRFMG